MKPNHTPAYAPTQTFLGCLRHLQHAGIPEHIDAAAAGISGRVGTWSHIRSSFRSLGLIDQDDRPTKSLQKIVSALDLPAWPRAVKEHLLPVYDPFIESIAKKKEKLTRAALNEEFLDAGCTSPDTLKKAVRFCADMHEEAGIRIPLVDVSRAVRDARKRKASKVSAANAAKAVIRSGDGRSLIQNHRFPLRQDLEIRISLPRDITHTEVARLAKFLGTIPLPE